MIISNSQVQTMLAQYLKQNADFPPAKKGESGKTGRDDCKNSVSYDVRAYSAAKEIIRDLPDIREERLANIQKQVKSGTYEITDEEVAEKMIGRSLVDKLV